MVEGNLYIVSAPSGGGKTSLTRALLPRLAQSGIEAVISVSYTTRAPRPGEQEGVHYHFVDEATFVSMIDAGAFLEHAEVFGRRYGTGRQRTEQLLASGYDVILDIDWQGARQVRSRIPSAQGIFILPPSLSELERRLRARSQDDEATIARRMREACQEMSHYGEYDYVIVNDDFDRALEQLAAVFIAGRLRCARQTRVLAPLITALLAK
ncbi:guanylate kinase [Fontimonas thermophila]|uniref:Guanylate kinase n=1 Tax=Fontimonas thermophila TaxID=1076937 RepID=A0A1I2KC79_9GAMM|nr:guanylate kinase [Fontimonas thermophila]SFF62711.1 guanylate kinase [Fontimonas thermophila]